MYRRQRSPNVIGRKHLWAMHTDDGSMRLRPHFPNMQVGDLQIAGLAKQLPDFFGDRVIGLIKQYGRSILHQQPRPACNHNSANDPHDRVEPYPAKVSAGQQRDDRHDRRDRIGEHMEVSRPQVVISMRMGVMPMRMAVIMTAAGQKKGADDIDQQTDDRNQGRHPELHLGRLK